MGPVRTIPYRTFTLAQLQEADAMDCGLCLACGAFRGDPASRQYRCELCGNAAVYGANEIIQMGRVAA